MIILDTDHVSLIQHQSAALREKILSRIDLAIVNEPVVTTIITYEEQVRGWFSFLALARTMKDQIIAYRRLRQHVDDYRNLQVIDFDESAAIEFQRLRGMKLRIGTMDLKIAAIALANRATLWSRNLQDFRVIPELRVIDATT